MFSLHKFKLKISLIFQSIWVICAYNMYSRLVLHTFFFLKCINVDGGPIDYLEKSPNIDCWDSREHPLLLLGAFLPCLLLWCIAWPIFLLKILYKGNRKLTDTLRSSQMIRFRAGGREPTFTSLEPQLNEESFWENRKIYQYLTHDYNTNCFYGRFISMLQIWFCQVWPIQQVEWIQFHKARQ